MSLAAFHARLGATLATAILGFALFAGASAAQTPIEGATTDGATFISPSQWAVGTTLSVSGTGWTTIAGDSGSTIAALYNRGTVLNPRPVNDNDEIWAVIVAAADGTWSAELPFPAEAGWAPGSVQMVHLLTGSLGINDKVRSVTLEITIIAPTAAP